MSYPFGQETIQTTVTPNEAATPLPTAIFDKIRSYPELQKFIGFSLRVQNPDWVEPDGNSPLCDSYEARFAKLLGLTYPLESDADGVGSCQCQLSVVMEDSGLNA
jgi:hypothetical protein